MSKPQKFESIDEYIASAPVTVRPVLEEIRRVIGRIVPSAKETISYQMPAFKLDKTFVYFAAFKKHIGVYPPVRADQALAEALLPYRGEKGNLAFPLDQPIPYELIGRVAATLAQKYSNSQDG
jgi:uncharacterized protein YdhG (YjbR/CyaY superfamily)